MNDTDFQMKIMTLCEEALSYEVGQREAYLDKVCTNDSALRNAVDKLIATVDRTSDFLQPAAEEVEFEAGEMVGDYRIVRNLGSGGMGNVYLAEREAEGYSQRVALKIMRTYLQSSDMISRFDEERRILARLHHPYIARLIDGGTTEKGLPYLVTELVEGIPIDKFCDVHRLTVNQRLDLVQKVALALQSAHQNLVVHSDLKPGNILVTDDGIPKLLDFGIAKLVKPVSAEKPDTSGTTDLVALTPDYASPEQIAGDVVTTISDVYSLGVLTYSLLVGETPYAFVAAPRAELMKRMETTVIRSPSEHVQSLRTPAWGDTIAGNRQTTLAKLSRRFNGDLDAILLKALRTSAQDRYPSALIFANDLKSFIRGMPVLAKGDATSYRLRKFVGRNRFSVAAGAAGLLALVAGLGVSMWQAHIAEKRFSDLHGFAETVIYEMHDEIANLPGGTEARRLMTRESIHYLDRLAQDAGSDRGLQLDLSKAYKRLGDVLGNPTNSNLGDVASAVDSYEKALAIAQKLSKGVEDDVVIERHKAIVHEGMADVLSWTGDLDGALTHSVQSQELFKSLVGNYPDAGVAVISVVISGVKRGDLLGHPSFPNLGRARDALQSYRDALVTITPLVESDNKPKGTLRYFAMLHERIGTMLSQAEQYPEALEHFETSLEIREQQAVNDPANANTRRDAAIAREKIGDVRLASGDAQAALPYYQDALTVYRSLAETDKENANAARTLAIGLENVSDALLAAGDSSAARVHFEEILAIRRELVANDSENQRLALELERVIDRANAL